MANCGNQNSAEARFCSQCGTRLAVAASPESLSETTATITFDVDERGLGSAESAAVDALPVGHALLVVQRGPSAGSRFLLDDETVSRRHAEFRRSGPTYVVADVGSLNGTYVNRDRIDEVTLQDGDEVQIGKYRLVFFASHASPAGEA